jgi:hypothetical protein
MPTRLALIALLLAAAPLRALALETTIGSASIVLPAPQGFCEFSASNASENRVLTTTGELAEKSGNRLLAMSAECNQLSGWHTGQKLLDDYANYQTPIATLQSGPRESIKETCAVLRAQGEKILANQLPDIKARVEKSAAGVKLNETKFIGVLAEDPAACYGGMIQKLHTALDTEKTQVIVFAVTIVKNKNVFAYRFAPYANPESVGATLAKLKADVAALYAKNK